MLVGLIVAIFIILLVVAVAAPRVAKSLPRDKEVEAIHRGNQYVRAVQLYYRKTGHYPGSIDQLEKTNNIRFLRQRYVDPMTGKPDWRLIHVGEAKTTVKGFFGKPLAGLPGAGGIGGSTTPGQSVGSGGASSASPTSSFGSSSSFGGAGGSNPASPTGGSSFGGSSAFGSRTGGTPADPSNPAGATGSATGTATVGSGTPGSTGIGSQSASTFTGGGAPIVGISSMATGSSITVLNEQTTYATWEFLYDPRIEQLKAKTSLLGGAAAGTPASSFGSGSGFGTPGAGVNGTAAPGTTAPTAPSTQPGTTPPQ